MGGRWVRSDSFFIPADLKTVTCRLTTHTQFLKIARKTQNMTVYVLRNVVVFCIVRLLCPIFITTSTLLIRYVLEAIDVYLTRLRKINLGKQRHVSNSKTDWSYQNNYSISLLQVCKKNLLR
jgi:hypothetical protein